MNREQFEKHRKIDELRKQLEDMKAKDDGYPDTALDIRITEDKLFRAEFELYQDAMKDKSKESNNV